SPYWVSGYVVYRATFPIVAGVPPYATVYGQSWTPFDDPGAAANTRYYYTVNAFDSRSPAHNESGGSVLANAACYAMSYSASKQQLPGAPGVGEGVLYRLIVANTGSASLDTLSIVDTVSNVLVNVGSGQPPILTQPIQTVVGGGVRWQWDLGPLWTLRNSMFTGRESLAAGVLNGNLYALGGYYNTPVPTVTTANEMYDPSTGSWTSKAPMLISRTGLAVAVTNGKLYVVGGTVDTVTMALPVGEYDPGTNLWTSRANMPTGRTYLSAGAVNGKIYAVGGVNGGALTLNQEYNPATNGWASKAAMPTPRFYAGVGVVNGKLYVVSGYDNSGLWSLTSAVDAYDPATDTWSSRAPILTVRGEHAVAVMHGRIYALGGSSPGFSNYLTRIEVYDPASNSWSSAGEHPIPLYRLAAGAIGGTLYTVGGSNYTGYYQNTHLAQGILQTVPLGTDLTITLTGQVPLVCTSATVNNNAVVAVAGGCSTGVSPTNTTTFTVQPPVATVTAVKTLTPASPAAGDS
ncbi:MAG: kelch repeat-containing protein, partial [bacterium]